MRPENVDVLLNRHIMALAGRLLLAAPFFCAHAAEWQSTAGAQWTALAVPATGKTGFTELLSSQTGVTLTNALPMERYLTNQILLNGSGVAAGDVDGDGWCDL
ncbi:MAG TPA: hypothetical protein P5055_23060, partial [Candidatus Paceibacterota bacterium]|nr:hypothetical protein [Candidatus Paceibacterota bacterium]